MATRISTAGKVVFVANVYEFAKSTGRLRPYFGIPRRNTAEGDEWCEMHHGLLDRRYVFRELRLFMCKDS